MTNQAIVVLDVVGLLLILWILDLIRRGRLYVGYGVVFLFTVTMMMLVVSFAPLLTAVTRAVGAMFPASALTMVALAYIFMMGIYIMTQITLLSERVAEIVQESAIRGAVVSVANAEKDFREVIPVSDPCKSSQLGVRDPST